jgi:hypothetical protein
MTAFWHWFLLYPFPLTVAQNRYIIQVGHFSLSLTISQLALLPVIIYSNNDKISTACPNFHAFGVYFFSAVVIKL